MENVIQYDKKTKILDWTGGIAAFLCALHCVALPFVLAVLPALGLAWLGSHLFGVGMVVFSFLLAASAIYRGYKQHKRCYPIAMATCGFLALFVGNFLFSHAQSHARPDHPIYRKYKNAPALCQSNCTHSGSNPLHHGANAFGGFLVAGAHIANRRICRKHCKTCKHEHKTE